MEDNLTGIAAKSSADNEMGIAAKNSADNEIGIAAKNTADNEMGILAKSSADNEMGILAKNLADNEMRISAKNTADNGIGIAAKSSANNGEGISTGTSTDISVELQYPQGIKWTRQRKAVYEVLRRAEVPLSAVQIYHSVEKSGDKETYAVSTIYRILSAFEKSGLVSKTSWMGDGTMVYELNRREHTHYAVCLECHKRIPLPSCPFAHMHIEQEAENFTVTGHKLELYGYCKDCKGIEKGANSI